MSTQEKYSDFKELKNCLDRLMLEGAIFRGVSDRTQMLPKLIRTEKDCSSFENYILDLFEKYYGIYSNASNCWEFLALAQHCGLMTRLIDFSYNPYVVLFFSLYNKNDNGEYEIWFIEKENIKQTFDTNQTAFSFEQETGLLSIDESLISENKSYSFQLSERFKDLKKKKGITIIKPNYRNSRMLMQQGLFVVPNKVSKESVMKEFELNAKIIVIDKSLRKEALEYLNACGFNELHLMPDIDSLCYSINHSVLDEDKIRQN